MKTICASQEGLLARDGPVIYLDRKKIGVICQLPEGPQAFAYLDTMHRDPKLGLVFVIPRMLFDWIVAKQLIFIGQDMPAKRAYVLKGTARYFAKTKKGVRQILISLNAFTIKQDVCIKPPRKKRCKKRKLPLPSTRPGGTSSSTRKKGITFKPLF